ncbi:hypothetical protein IP88_02370 [alpha proteobacterium AAP81b]|nr:hypothetical protein IP88_02370 [alpha proteobacterium AAP81b]
MRAIILTAALALAGGAQAATPELAAPIKQFIDAMNKGDIKTAKAATTADLTVTDEVPPFVWQGRGAFDAWIADLGKHESAAGIAAQKMTIRPASREVVAGEAAYVIVPATFTFTQNAAPMREPAQLTFALRKTAAGWKIAAWTFTGPNPKPIKPKAPPAPPAKPAA